MNNHDSKKADKKFSANIHNATANVHSNSNVGEHHPTITVTASKKTQPPSPMLTLIGTNDTDID